VHEDFIKACRSGDILCISKCLNLDSSILEVPDSKHGWTGLYRTVMCGNTLASEFLLSKGASTKVKDNKGYSLLFQAVNNSQVQEVSLLLRFPIDLNELQPGNL
jgi:ankyrin repeat protein